MAGFGDRGRDVEPLEDLALLVEARLRRRHYRGGLEVRLRYQGRRGTFVLDEEAVGLNLPEILMLLIAATQEIEAAGSFEAWSDADTRMSTSPSATRGEWRRRVRQAESFRRLLADDFDRFAAAE